jgi:hypothetical protein
MPSFEEAKKVFDEYHKETAKWVRENRLTEMPEYESMRDKGTIGKHYRDDTLFFEEVSNLKSKYFALRSYFNKEHADANREQKREIDVIIAQIDDYNKLLDATMSAARARLKLYESIIYLVANFSYGDF